MDERYEFSEGGMRLLILEISFPERPEGVAGERLGAFLSAAAQAVRQSAEDAIPRLFSRYENDPDPKKRFRYRPFVLSLSFSTEKKKRYYLVTERITLTRGGRVLFEKKRAARFDLQSGRLLGIKRKF
jgi:hypothetical protein